MIPHLTHYQESLLSQIIVSLGLSSYYFIFPQQGDDPFRVLSFIMLFYSFFCGYLFVYYDPTSGGTEQ